MCGAILVRWRLCGQEHLRTKDRVKERMALEDDCVLPRPTWSTGLETGAYRWHNRVVAAKNGRNLDGLDGLEA